MRASFTDNSDNINGDLRDNIDITIDWGGQSKTPMFPYSREMLIRFASRLFIGDRKLGGKVDPDACIPGFTQVVVNNVIYRSHPSYSKKGSWFDWAYFDWEGFVEPIPARIMMIVDLSDTDIIYDRDVDETDDVDETSSTNEDDDDTILHLSNEKWVIVMAARSPKVDDTDISDLHFDSKIHHRIKLHDQKDLFLIKLSSLVGPCSVVQNKDYTSGLFSNDIQTDDTCYVVQPKIEWPKAFLPPS